MHIGQTQNKVFHPENKKIIFGDPESLLFCCGKNKNYELSFKNVEYFNSPAGVKFSKKHKISEVSTMGSHTAFLSEWGELYLFGSNLCEKLGFRIVDNINIHRPKLFERSSEVQVEQVCCGENYTLCLFKGGETWAWGGTLHKKASKNLHPNKIFGLSKYIVRQISCGVFHSAAVTEDGYLFTWGGGGEHYNKGQLGHNSLDDIASPEPVKYFQDKPIFRVECGEYHTMALTEDYEMYAWGSGQFGELGNDLCQDCSEPQKVIFPERTVITKFAGGKNHSMFVTNQGKLYACGKASHGQLGIGSRLKQQIPVLVQCLQRKLLVDVKCGVNHTIVLGQGGYAYSTGNNDFGQLGLGHNDTQISFSWIESLRGKKIKKIFAGGNHSWFLLDYDTPYDIEDRSPSPPIKISSQQRSTSNNKNDDSSLKNSKIQRKNSNNSRYSQSQKIDLSQQKEKRTGKGQISSFLKNKQDIDLPRNNSNNQSFLKKNRQLNDQSIYSQNRFNTPGNNKQDRSTDFGQPKQIQNKPKNIFDHYEDVSQEENIFNNHLPTDKNDDSGLDSDEDNDQIIEPDNKPGRKRPPQNDLDNHDYMQTFGGQNFNNNKDGSDKQRDIQDLDKFKYNKKDDKSEPEEEEDSEEEDNPSGKFQEQFQQKKRPRNYNTLEDEPNSELQTSFDSINQFLEKRFTCYYNLFFTDFKYNHKFFLITYKKEDEQQLEEQLQNATQLIDQHDPQLIHFKMGKYEKFYKEENQILSVLQVEEDNQDSQEYENYVLMLIQTSEAFELQYGEEQRIPDSPYHLVDKLKTSVTPLYYFTPELIEKDKKWKILSITCEIVLNQLRGITQKVKIYELRSSKYK